MIIKNLVTVAAFLAGLHVFGFHTCDGQTVRTEKCEAFIVDQEVTDGPSAIEKRLHVTISYICKGKECFGTVKAIVKMRHTGADNVQQFVWRSKPDADEVKLTYRLVMHEGDELQTEITCKQVVVD